MTGGKRISDAAGSQVAFGVHRRDANGGERTLRPLIDDHQRGAGIAHDKRPSLLGRLVV
jgi:hypothetical protein